MIIAADTLISIGLSAISLGTIHEADGLQEHDFWFRNTGENAVILRQGYTSCGCTTILFDKEHPIAPGDSTCITLRFNPQGKGGEFLETGTVRYDIAPLNSQLSTHVGGDLQSPTLPPRSSGAEAKNTSPLRGGVHVSLSGTCISSEESLMRQFPIRLTDHLRLSTNHFDIGILPRGGSKTVNVVVLHREDNDRQELIPITCEADSSLPNGINHLHPILRIQEGDHEVEAEISIDLLVR